MNSTFALPYYINNTTLVIFAVVAALGLMTALMVVEPNLPQAFAQGESSNRERACEHAGASHIKFCSNGGGGGGGPP
jgi:hypothetical protein